MKQSKRMKLLECLARHVTLSRYDNNHIFLLLYASFSFEENRRESDMTLYKLRVI